MISVKNNLMHVNMWETSFHFYTVGGFKGSKNISMKLNM